MSGKIFKILNTLDTRLRFCSENSQLNYPKQGIVFGFTSVAQNNESFCVGVTGDEDDIPFANVQLGAYFLGDTEDSTILDYCASLTKNKKTGKLLVLIYSSERDVRVYDIKSKNFSTCNYELSDYSDALINIVQISLNLVLHVKFDYFKEKFTENVKNCFEKAMQTVADAAFTLEGSSFELSSDSDSKLTVEDLYSQIEEFDELADIQIPKNMRKKMVEKYQKNLKNKKQILQFHHLSTSDKQKEFCNSPIQLSDAKSIEFFIPVKFFFNLQLRNNLGYLYKVFNSSVSKIISRIQNIFLESSEATTLTVPEFYNFYDPSVYTHVISTVYHQIQDDDNFLKQREKLHLKYLVPTVKPTFKIVNSLHYKSDSETRLCNVHVGLNSGLKNGQCVTVSGRYLYFHYNQDQTNDSGWGCAYRSLQTIISWFKLQGYIDIDIVPTHKEIQQTLVDVGDKEPNFVGSSKWIGSQEVCYVLSHRFNIDSKIIFINSGAELANKARELIEHFNKNGTPVMIGGGVLAHTIIGVNFDEKTGNVKYLVLDPHYVGDEDIAVIQRKGWCGWKDVSFWDKNSFYNLCLPQKPDKF